MGTRRDCEQGSADMTLAAASPWLAHFPGLTALKPSSQATLAKTARQIHAGAGSCLFAPGQMPTAYLLALSGSIRVQKTSETGREMVLYRVGAGESCVLTTACMIGEEAYEAEAIAETDVEAIALPRAAFDALVAEDAAFRRFVFTSFGTRMTELLRLIDDVAFARIDTRLAHKLVELCAPGGTITMTQQQLAAELGSAREVVSRQLQEFQRRGWIGLARGTITIRDASALTAYARGQ
jgi:CRP/FNR family transcriptional regulator